MCKISFTKFHTKSVFFISQRLGYRVEFIQINEITSKNQKKNLLYSFIDTDKQQQQQSQQTTTAQASSPQILSKLFPQTSAVDDEEAKREQQRKEEEEKKEQQNAWKRMKFG